MDEQTLNPTAASLLGLLLDGPLTASALVAVAQQRIGGFWTLTRSQVYRELAALERLGLVTAADDRTATRTFEVTDTGAAAFTGWAAQAPEAASTRLPLLLLVSLGRHVDTAVLRRTLTEETARRVERLAGYEAFLATTGRHLDPYARATVDFGIAYERAVLAWLEALPPAVRGRGAIPRPGG